MSYSSFAEFYDTLQSDVGYGERAGYLMKLFGKYDRLPSLLLDVACGTGGFSLEFAKGGVDVIGVDMSPEMLNVAGEKLRAEGKNALLLCQKADELDLYGTVDGAICTLDSLNHITGKKEFERSIGRISLFLEPGRLFIFDLNTTYKHKKVLSGTTFAIDAGSVYCVWKNSQCSRDGKVDIGLDFFARQKDGSYRRSSEEFSERAYTPAFVGKCLDSAGLETVAVLGDMTDEKPQKTEQRVIYVTRKKQNG